MKLGVVCFVYPIRSQSIRLSDYSSGPPAVGVVSDSGGGLRP